MIGLRTLGLIGGTLLFACSVNAQDGGVAKPNLLLKQTVEGMPKGDKQEISVLTATLRAGRSDATAICSGLPVHRDRAHPLAWVKEAGMVRSKISLPILAILFLAMLSSGERFGHVAKAQTIANVLAAQIRTQGFACDEPQKATRDAKLSKPDYDVWVLTCKNATYRIGRYPDLAAKVEKLK